MSQISHWVGGLDNGVPVAICREYDLVATADRLTDLPAQCERVLRDAYALQGPVADVWWRRPPPEREIAQALALPEMFEFTITREAS